MSGSLFLLPAYYAYSIGQISISIIVSLLAFTSVTHIIFQQTWLRLIDYLLAVTSLLSGVWILYVAQFPHPASLYVVALTATSLACHAWYDSAKTPQAKDVLYVLWHILAVTLALVALWASTQ